MVGQTQNLGLLGQLSCQPGPSLLSVCLSSWNIALILLKPEILYFFCCETLNFSKKAPTFPPTLSHNQSTALLLWPSHLASSHHFWKTSLRHDLFSKPKIYLMYLLWFLSSLEHCWLFLSETLFSLSFHSPRLSWCSNLTNCSFLIIVTLTSSFSSLNIDTFQVLL